MSGRSRCWKTAVITGCDGKLGCLVGRICRICHDRSSIAIERDFACELAGFDLSDVNGFVFIRSFLRAKAKAKQINSLVLSDVL